jgi:cell division inhibitor SepF
MASMWKRAMTYLGLGDDEDYADYDDYEDPGSSRQRPPQARPPVREPDNRGYRPVEETPEVSVRGTVRPLGPDRSTETGVGMVTARGGPPAGRGAVVRPLPIPVTAKPHVVIPTSFNQAQEVADTFKGNAPVIMNLQEVDRDLSRRLIDFASGLCYGLGGAMDKVANSVYLLTPADVQVSDEDKRRLQERGYSS